MRRSNFCWTDTTLVITSAWSDKGHSAKSSHYEGRAADLTTVTVVDKKATIDATKLGRLAQLAVDSGFDWVFYEDAKHVHASVKK